MKKKAIGLFDSGIGGLTVLQSLMKEFPSEDYIYLADGKYFPYGTKTDKEIEARVLKMGEYLHKFDVKLIIIACNTASIFANSLRKRYDIPIISIIEPTVDYAITKTKTNKIAILATKATINAHRYQDLLMEKGIDDYPVACSEFVELIEYGKIDTLEMKEIIKEKLKPLQNQNIDTVILGCTHFSLIEQQLRQEFATQYINSFPGIIKEVKDKIVLNDEINKKTNCQIFTTGSKDELIASAKVLGEFVCPIKQI